MVHLFENHGYKIALDVECNPIQGASVRGIIRALKSGEAFEKYTPITEMAFTSDDTVESIRLEDGDYRITVLTRELLNMREY